MQRSSLASIVVGFRALRVNPMRTVLSTLGVIIGVAALVSVLALGDGMERFARDEIRSNGSMLAVELRSMASREVDGVVIPDTAAPRFSASDAAALGRLPGVDHVSMTAMGPTLVARDTVRSAAIVRGSLAGVAARDSLSIAHGRFFTDADVMAEEPVAVLSHRLATAIAADAPVRSLVGDTLQMNGHSVLVIGVLGPPQRRVTGGRPGRPEQPSAYVPVSVAGRYQMTSGAAPRPSILLLARQIEDVKPLRKAVQAWVLATHPDWRGRVQVRIDEKRGEKAQQGILMFKLLMGAMTGISLIVGGIGIMNVLLASVAERTREIGIRKAIGARQRDILVQFLSESVAISGLGSAIGLGLGLAGALVVTTVMQKLTEAPVQPGFSISTLIVTLTAAVGVGLVFGTYPALRAARLSPIEAIHHE